MERELVGAGRETLMAAKEKFEKGSDFLIIRF